MRICNIKDLNQGMVLAQPLRTFLGARQTLLLGRGAQISTQIIDKLTSMGYTSIYIEEEGTEHIQPDDMLSEETHSNVMLAISQYYEEMHHGILEMLKENPKQRDLVNASALPIKPPPSNLLRENIKEVMQDLFVLGTDQKYVADAAIPRTNAIYTHSLNVMILTMLIGSKYNYVDSEQSALGMGAVLHDIGKTGLPDIYSKSYVDMNVEERTQLRVHPALGEKMLHNSRVITEVERQIIMQHHERQDGTGYPTGLKGNNRKPLRLNFPEPNQMFRFAEIVAVTNVYDNLTSGNLDGISYSPSQALKMIQNEAGTRFNSEIVNTLKSIVIRFPAASNAIIAEHPDPSLKGCKGVVAQSEKKGNLVELVVLFDAEGNRIPAKDVSININSSSGQRLELLM